MLSLRSSSPSTFSSLPLPLQRYNYKNLSYIRKPNASAFFVCRIGVEDITEIVHNKVLISAAVSAAIGQISKPFTTSLFYGENVNLRRFIGAGGFPSSHSSGVVAAATSLGLERGFSDSIFGMSVIFAAVVMYDAQAVRWEVGKHAQILNKSIVFKNQKRPLPNGNQDTGSSKFTNSKPLAPLLSVSENKTTSSAPSSLAVEVDDSVVLEETWTSSATPLEESIGHTLVDVTAGALLGFLVTLGVFTVM